MCYPGLDYYDSSLLSEHLQRSPADFDVIGIGSCSFDTTIVLGTTPTLGEKAEARQVYHGGGGLLGTAMVTLSRLGSKTALVARIGDDWHSGQLVSDLVKQGVNVSMMARKTPGACRMAYSLVQELSDERTVIWSKHEASLIGPEEFELANLKRTKWLMVDAHEPMLSKVAVAEAQRIGVRVAVDLDCPDEGLEFALPGSSLIFVSQTYSHHHFKGLHHARVAEEVHEKYNATTVVTAGCQGAWVAGAADSFHQKAVPAAVVDTTGAGDVFHGAFLHAVLKHCPMRDSALFAATAAAISCEHYGSRSGIPDCAMILERMPAHGVVEQNAI